MKLRLLAIFSIVIITLIVYSNSITGEFISNYDDELNVVNNIDIKELSINSLQEFFSKSYLGMYSPLTMLSYAVDYRAGGLNPIIYHIDNLIFHLLNIILAFYLFYLISEKIEVAFIAGLLMGIHPMNVEGVSLISVRGNLLYSFFFLGALICYVKYLKIFTTFRLPNENNNTLIQNLKPGLTHIKIYYILSLLLFILSSLSKSAAVTFPVLMLLFDFYFKRKINLKLFIEKIPFIIPAIIFGLVTIYFRSKAGHLGGTTYNIIDRIVLSSYCILFYIIKFFAPLYQSVYYIMPIKTNGYYPVIYYLSVIPVLIIFVVIYLYRNKRLDLFFGFVFFLITISFVGLKIIPGGNQIVCERYAYIPYLGFIFIAGKFYIYTKEKINSKPYIKKITSIIISIFIVFFCIKTYSRNIIWHNSINLWTDFMENNPNDILPYIARGTAKAKINDFKGAIDDFNKAILLEPDNGDIFYNRGLMKYKLKNIEGAFNDYDKALSAKKSINRKILLYDVYYNRGKLWMELKDYKSAENNFISAIKIDSTNGEIYNNLGTIEFLINKNSEAIRFFSIAISRKPNFSDAYFNRGITYIKTGNIDRAIDDFSEVIKINPDDIEAKQKLNKLKDDKKNQ